jgi:hypothetical protein
MEDPAPPEERYFFHDDEPSVTTVPPGRLATHEEVAHWFREYMEAHKGEELFKKSPKGEWVHEEDEEMPPAGTPMGASVPAGETILVPPDQLYKEVTCHACGVTRRTETRFQGVYTCGACQWKGLAPLKQPESVVNAVSTEEEQQKVRRKDNTIEASVPVAPRITSTIKETTHTFCRLCRRVLDLPGKQLGYIMCVQCKKERLIKYH